MWIFNSQSIHNNHEFVLALPFGWMIRSIEILSIFIFLEVVKIYLSNTLIKDIYFSQLWMSLMVHLHLRFIRYQLLHKIFSPYNCELRKVSLLNFSTCANVDQNVGVNAFCLYSTTHYLTNCSCLINWSASGTFRNSVCYWISSDMKTLVQ